MAHEIRRFLPALAFVAFAPIAQAAEVPPPYGFALSLRERPDGPVRTVVPAMAATCRTEVKGGEAVVSYAFTNAPVRAVRAFSRRVSPAAVACTLEVDTAGGWHLERMAYPEVRVGFAGADARADRLVLGHSKGGVVVDPLSKLSNVSDGLRDSSLSAIDWCHTCDIPGSGIAQFAAYWNGRRGVYFGSDDDSARVQTLGFFRSANGLSFSHFRFGWETGLVRMGYEVTVREVAGGEDLDWHDFADIYREWERGKPWRTSLVPYAERMDVPAWMKDAPAMVRFSRQWLADPDGVARFVRWWRRTFGPGPVIAALWGWEKVGTWWGPDYFPCWPDDATFRRVTKILLDNDFHPFAWPSGYNWCERSGIRADGTCELDYRETFLKSASDKLCLGRDGKPFIRDAYWLRNGKIAAVCGGLDWTHDWWNGIVAGLGERGCEIVQVDQVVGGLAPECWSPRHGHPVDYLGPWMASRFDSQLVTMRAALLGSQPSGAVCIEEPNEKLIGRVALQDYRDIETRADEFAGVFSYLHHGYLPAFQSNLLRDEPYTLAYMAAEGQIPFYRMCRADIEPTQTALLNGGFEDLIDNVRGPVGWTRLSDLALLTGYDRRPPSWDFNGWFNFGWGLRDVVLDADERRSGEFSLRLSVDASSKLGSTQVSQLVENLAPGEYVVSAWAKGRGAGRLLWGSRAGEEGAAAIPQGDAWTNVTGIAHADRGELKVVVHVTGGTLWIDDVRILRRDGKDAVRTGPTLYSRTYRRWLSLYRGEGRPFLSGGFRIRPPRIDCARTRLAARDLPAVCAAAYRSADGREAIVLANGTRECQRCAFVWRGKRRECVLEAGDIMLIR